MVVIIFGIAKLLLKISNDCKMKFLDFLPKVKGLGTFEILIVDSVDNIKKQEYNEWYKGMVDNSTGIWVGNGIGDQSLIKTNIGFKKTNNEVPNGYGIIVKSSKTFLVNLIRVDNNESIDEKGDEIL